MGQRPVAMKKHRINAHPARRIYRKIGRIESGVRQKTFGSCDLIMEGETGDAKCLTPSTLAPPVAGLLFVGPLGTPWRGLRTLARHPHHLSAGRASDRGQPAPARGVQSVRVPLATKIARRRTATRRRARHLNHHQLTNGGGLPLIMIIISATICPSVNPSINASNACRS